MFFKFIFYLQFWKMHADKLYLAKKKNSEDNDGLIVHGGNGLDHERRNIGKNKCW